MTRDVYRVVNGRLEVVPEFNPQPYYRSDGTEDFDSFVAHYGTITNSGRYPWGSGEDPYQRLRDYQGKNARLKRELNGDMAAVAKAMGFDSQSEYRRFTSIVTKEKRERAVDEAIKLKKRNWSNVAIAEKLGVSKETVAKYLKPREDSSHRHETRP